MSSTRNEDPGRGDVIDSPATRKYRLFKRLLDRNRDALDSLANLEQAYYGGGVASMADLRARYDGLSKSVHELAAHLRELAGDEYAGLESVIDGIDREVAARLRLGRSSTTGDLVVPLQSLGPEASGSAGGKATHLATISRVGGVSIPDGFVVTTAGFQSFVRENALEKPIEEALASVSLESPGTLEAASKAIQSSTLQAPVPAELASRILSAYDALRRGSTAEVQVAVRSSAVGEDSEASFAGQYTTVLGVGRAGVLDAYRSVIASKYSPGAIQYRLRFGLEDGDTPIAALAMVMIDARSSGVLTLQFSGGVGSQYGKSLRLTFLGAVLERLGFRVVITGDILDAQLVGHDAASAGDVLDQVARLLASSRLLDMAISHRDRVESMVDAFFKADYDFLGEGLTQRLPGFYTQDGEWTSVEEDGRTLFVQDGTEWGAGLTSGFTKLMRKVVGGPKYQEFLDNVQAYFHFPKAIAKASAVTDAALSLRVRPMGGVIDRAGGLAFAVRNMANYFALRINALEDNVILFEFVNGRRYQRATVARRIETGRWYSVAAVVRGNSVQGFLDDEPLLEYSADRLLEGYVGMWTKADSLTHFADLRIERRS